MNPYNRVIAAPFLSRPAAVYSFQPGAYCVSGHDTQQAHLRSKGRKVSNDASSLSPHSLLIAARAAPSAIPTLPPTLGSTSGVTTITVHAAGFIDSR